MREKFGKSIQVLMGNSRTLHEYCYMKQYSFLKFQTWLLLVNPMELNEELKQLTKQIHKLSVFDSRESQRGFY